MFFILNKKYIHYILKGLHVSTDKNKGSISTGTGSEAS